MTGAANASKSMGVALGDGSPLTGTGTLIRFLLRRDRLYIPGWILGISALWLYVTRLVPTAYPEEDLQGVGPVLSGPMGRLLTGPGFGFGGDLHYDVFVAGGYGLYVILLAAIMSILLVVRHTRSEEQAGRAELIRANVVGRHAPLAATLLVAVLANVAAALAVTLVMITDPKYPASGAVLLAAGVAVTGMGFAGLAAVTAQLTQQARAAGGMAGAGLGAAFTVRALGDMAREGGNFLSWLSPLAWPQQTAPYVLDRWWPLVLSLAFAGVTMATAFVLGGQRDVGASPFTVRPGPDRAPPWLGSPLALAFRLQRTSILWWAAAMAVFGLVIGAFTDAMHESFEDLPEALIEVLGGEGDIIAGYVSVMGLFMALITGIFVVLGVQGLRHEEKVGRAEPLLALPISRRAWLGTNLIVIAAGMVFILCAVGLGSGLGAVIVTGDVQHLWDFVLANVVFVPPLLLLLGLAALCFGVAPRFSPITWVVLGYGLVGVYGPLMDLPGWAYDLSPFEHVGRVPVDPVQVLPLVVLTLIGAVLVAGALIGFRQRDINAN